MRKILLGLLVAVALASCSKHESLFDYDRVKEEAKENFPVKDIDPNHNWNMIEERTLKVTVDEACTIRVYTSNPFNTGEDAKLLAETDTENATTVTLKFEVALAKKLLYVAKTDKKQFSLVKTSLLEGEVFSDVTFGNASNPRSVSTVSRSIDYTVPDNIFNCPTGIKEIKNAADLRMTDNGVIETGTTVKLKDSGNWIEIPTGKALYIKGTLEVEKCHDSFFPTGTKTCIVVCEGGKIICGESIKLWLSGNGNLYNKGQILIQKKDDAIVLDNQSFLYNEGQINFTGDADIEISNAVFVNAGNLNGTDADLNLSTGAKFLNQGRVNLDDTEINKAEWLNEGKYISKDFDIKTNGGSIINRCVLTVKDFDFEASGAVFESDGYVECKEADFDNGTLNLAAGSIFNVTGEVEFKSYFTVNGEEGVIPALLYMGTAKADDDFEYQQGNANKYTGNLYVSCPAHFVKPKNEYIVPQCSGKASLVTDKAQITEPTDEQCEGSYTIPNVTLPTKSEVFTFAFEDIMTKAGDYDFNDVVLKVDLLVKEGKRQVRLVAAGATNDLYVKYRNRKSNFSKDLFEGKEVHAAMKCEPGSLVNTAGENGDEAIDYIPADNTYSLANDCDFYIVGSDEIEIHLPIHSEGWKDGDVPFAIAVPADWAFPAERQKINAKYPGFGEWGADRNQNIGWYQ